MQYPAIPRIVAVVIGLAIASPFPDLAVSQTYRFVTLSHPEGAFTPTGINNAYQVAGTLVEPDNSYHALVRHVSGRYVGLPEMAGNRSRAYGINDLGHVGGWTLDGNGFGHAGVWRNGVFDEQSVPSGATTVPIALDLNNKSEAVGYYRGASSILHAFYWDAQGNVTKLPELSGGSSVAYAINESSEIAGAATLTGGMNHAVVWRKNMLSGNFEIEDLGSLGGPNSIAYDINNAGHVVGAAQNTSTTNHAFFWDGTTMQDLQTLGGANSGALAINDSGVIVGRSEVSSLLGAASGGGSLSLTTISTELEATMEGPPALSPAGAPQHPALAGPLDRAAKLLKDQTSTYGWRDYNDRVPVGSPIIGDAFAMNDSRAALTRELEGDYGILIPFKGRNLISACSTPTGPCPEIDGFEVHPYSGLISLAIGADAPLNPPLDLTYTSRPDFEEDLNILFGIGIRTAYSTRAAHFQSGYAEVSHSIGQMDLFKGSIGSTWVHRSNCRMDQLFAIEGGKASPEGSQRPGSTQVQPQMVLRRESDNLFYFYRDDGLLAAVEDANGKPHTVTHTGDRLTDVTDDFGNSITFTYNGSGLVSGVSDGTRSFQFAYTGGYLTSITDPMGRVTSFEYDDAHPIPGLLSSVTLPKGNTRHQFAYDDDGRLIRVTDATGGIWNIAYEGFDLDELSYPYRNHRTSITDPLGRTVTYVYDLSGDLTEVVDQTGSSITYAYDNLGMRASITDRLGGSSQITYDPSIMRPERVTEADGTNRTYTYGSWTAHGLTIPALSTILYPDGGTESYTYDAKGNLVSFQDPGGNAWTYTYNASGRRTGATNPAGGTTSFTYNPDGSLASFADNAGNSTSFQYDALDRMTRAQGADGSAAQWTYDMMDRVLSSTDENGATREFTYDLNGNLIGVEDALGNTSSFGYDAMDRVISFTDPLGAIATFSYDALHRPVQATDRNGNSLSAAYSAAGRLQSITDAGGNTWQFSTDAEGILASTTDPGGRMTSFSSDPLGRTTGITSGAATTAITRDNLGRLTGVVGPDGWATTRQLNDLGLPDQITLPNGAMAQYSYDPAGQLTQAVDPEGGAWSQQRDAQGRLMSRGDPVGGGFLYSHDNMNRPVQASLPGGMGTMTLTYDPAGNLTGRGYSDGTSHSFTYDAESRLTGMTGGAFAYDARGRMTQSNGIAITRDLNGRITSMTLAPGRTVSYQYNSRNLVTRVEDWLGTVVQFEYDAVGRLTGISRPSGVQTTLAYDGDGRLASAQEGSLSSIELTRDVQGRVSTAERNTPVPPDSLMQSSRSLAFDAAARVTGYQYDAMGRLLSDVEREYTWNLASHLTEYHTDAGGTVACTYDALGNRLTRSSGGVTHTFVWNYALGLPSVSVIRSGGSDQRYFVHTPDGVLLYSVEASDGERRFYHFDEAGNTIAVTSMAGAVLAAYAYSPYGAILASSGSGDDMFTFGGQYGVQQEGATGLFYMRARYYDSRIARFVSRDPLQSFSPELLNPYQYALGNPLVYGDPTGMEPLDLPPSPQAPSPLRSQSEFGSRDDFLRHYEDWSGQMERWLKDVRERDRLIDELRKKQQAEFLKKWNEGWEEYGRAVEESNLLILHQELLSRGHAVSQKTVRLLQAQEGITSVEEFEEYLARGRAAAMAVHNQAMAAMEFAVQAQLASRREAAKPCPVPVSTGVVVDDPGDTGVHGTKLLGKERKEIKSGLGTFRWFFGMEWLR